MNKDLAQPKRSFSFEELLRFYQDAGVDISILEQPINRLTADQTPDNKLIKITTAEKQNLNNNTTSSKDVANNQDIQKKPTKTLKKITYIAHEDQIKLAHEKAMSSKTLEELYQNLLTFDDCPLKTTAKNTCFSDGNSNSPLMVIGDVPEREEDMQGLPFVGQAGALLNKMLAAIDFNREDTYIANVVPWRPPGNREPTSHEIELCKPFIYRQIELANPKVIIAFGGTTATWLTGINDGILRMRGNWLQFTTSNHSTIHIMPTLHPRYLLRNPAHKKFTWQDLLNIKIKLRKLSH